MAFTKIAAAGIGSTELVTLHSLEVLNNATVGGVLTYEDVTNVDSIGIITARTGILVGSGITLSKDGNIFSTGISTFSDHIKFANSGDGIIFGKEGGSNRPSILGNYTASTNNNLQFNTTGSQRLKIDTDGRVLIGGNSAVIASGDEFNEIVLTGKTRGAGITLQDVDANTRFQIRTDDAGSDGPQTLLNASTNHPIVIRTNNTEAVRITNTGNIGIGTTNPHTISGYTGLTLNHITHGGFVQFADNGTNTSRVVGGPNALELATQTSIPILFKTAGDDVRMSISATGDINVHNTTAASSTDPVTLDLGGQYTANASITNSNLKLKLYSNGSTGDSMGITASASGVAYVSGHTTGHVFYTVPSSVDTLVERLRITSNGNIIVGDGSADTPYAPLHVYAENGRGLNAIFGKGFVDNAAYHYDDANVLFAGQDVDGNQTGAGAEFIARNVANSNWFHGAITMNRYGALHFTTGGLGTYAGTVKGVLTSGGKFSIGNPAEQTPTRLLYVDTGTTGDGMRIKSDEVLGDFVVNNTGDGHGRAFVINASRVDSGTLPKLHLAGQGSITLAVDANSTRMTIDASGNIGAPSGNNIYNASDERLKENMIDLTNGLDKINKLKPVSFTWKNGWSESLDGVTQYGFGAQTTQSVDELLVEPFSTGDVELNGETIENPLRVNEKHIIPLLVKAIQELSAKVAALEG